MKNSRVLFVLAFLSFALLAAVASLIISGPGRTGGPGSRQSARESDATNIPAAGDVERTAEAPAQRGTEPFSWHAIESSDYKQYIANLRTIRCPEKTIRSLIIADVNKLYAPREAPFKESLAGFAAGAAKTATTDSTTRPNELARRKREFELRKQWREVEEEKSALLKELLGFELPLAPLRSWSSRSYERGEAALDALPADKREQARRIEESYWQISDQLNEKHDFQRTPQFLEEYKQVNADRKARLAQVLTPEELEEFERAQDGDYRYLSQLGERYNLPKEKILQAYQIQRAMNSQVQQLSNDPNQNLLQRLQAIQAIAAQNQDALKQLLGERAYKIFSRGNGNQIQAPFLVE